MKPALSLILPANNEAAHIGACLRHVLASDALPKGAAVQTIVVANGCSDDTVQIAQAMEPEFQARGWQLEVLELAQGNKIAALNAGEAAAQADVLAYLDADVLISPSLLSQTVAFLSEKSVAYASGQVCLAVAKTTATRAYAKFYEQTPFLKQTAPGCGYFAMNQAGRKRWDLWPAIISDDTYARLKFASHERHQLSARYDWPLVEGLHNLIKVRRRQNAGVDELSEKHPDLFANDSKERFGLFAALKAAVRHPFGALVYGMVSIAVKLTPGQKNDWKRGR